MVRLNDWPRLCELPFSQLVQGPGPEPLIMPSSLLHLFGLLLFLFVFVVVLGLVVVGVQLGQHLVGVWVGPLAVVLCNISTLNLEHVNITTLNLITRH